MQLSSRAVTCKVGLSVTWCHVTLPRCSGPRTLLNSHSCLSHFLYSPLIRPFVIKGSQTSHNQTRISVNGYIWRSAGAQVPRQISPTVCQAYFMLVYRCHGYNLLELEALTRVSHTVSNIESVAYQAPMSALRYSDGICTRLRVAIIPSK